jgi:hypothetical protein
MTASLKTVGINLDWVGENWGLEKWTYVIRYAGTPLAEATPARLNKLIAQYPAIYSPRHGKCESCKYRPCLKYAANNPLLYVGKTIGGYKLEKYLKGRGWQIKCLNCGNTKLVSLLCSAMPCTRCKK